jgi:2-methylcitrate dehydratase
METSEIERFLALAQRLPELRSTELGGLTIVAKPGLLSSITAPIGIF